MGKTEPTIPPIPHKPEIMPEPQKTEVAPSIPEVKPERDPQPAIRPSEFPPQKQ